MAVSIVGYSERGMINAICADVARSNSASALIERFLKLIHLPQHIGPSPFERIDSVEIMVEQSFSTFGDPDIVFLLQLLDGTKHAIFVEAKVHTDVRAGRAISQRWDFFQNCLDCEATRRPSGLFTQMYRSQRLIHKLCSTDTRAKKKFFGGTKIGRNRVVKKAAEKVSSYLENVSQGWVVALLPEPASTLDLFFRGQLANYHPAPAQLPNWDVRNWGFITWEQIDTLCLSERNEWMQTLAAFDWNHEQVYVGRRDRTDLKPPQLQE